MKLSRITLSVLVALVILNVAVAQRRRTTPQPAAAKPTSTATPTPVPQPAPAPPERNTTTIATVNDVAITAPEVEADLNEAVMRDSDPFLRDYYTDPAKAIREARLRAVDAKLGSMLVAAEAKKRNKSANEIIETEINSRVTPPSDAEVQAAYDANRDQLGSADLDTVRPQLINFIRNQRREELYKALINRLKMTNVITKNADVNAPNLTAGTVIAAINGEPLRVDVINERVKAYAYKMDRRLYALKKQSLDRRINDLLIVAEASQKKVTPEEIVRTEITDKIKTPSDADVSKFYNENKAAIKGDLAATRNAIAAYLQQQQQEQLEVDLANRLRTAAKVQVFLREPEAPVMNISQANGASRGDVNAAVTVVEFTDFQCSACGGMYPIVEEVLKSYGNRVHFVIRNFPLTSIHENAFNAAQAAEAAKAQGKFWEYIDVLFKNQTTLDRESLKKYATQVGLDRKRFDSELDGGVYEALIRRDLDDGEGYGIEGTPAFFINGVMLTEYSGEGLRAAIEKAFSRSAAKP